MAKSVGELKAIAEDLVDEVKEKIEDGFDVTDAINEVVGDAAETETSYFEDNWELINEAYNNSNIMNEYDIGYYIDSHCDKTNDVKKLLAQTAFAIAEAILTTEISNFVE